MRTRALKLQSKKSLKPQQGLAVVELVIAVPLILLVALAVTELGRGLNQYNTLSQAVHDGTRYLGDRARNGIGEVDPSGLVDETKNLVIYGTIKEGSAGDELLPDFLSRGTVEVVPDWIEMSDGQADDNHIKVTATYRFDPLFLGLSALGYSMVPKFEVTAVERVLVR